MADAARAATRRNPKLLGETAPWHGWTERRASDLHGTSHQYPGTTQPEPAHYLPPSAQGTADSGQPSSNRRPADSSKVRVDGANQEALIQQLRRLAPHMRTLVAAGVGHVLLTMGALGAVVCSAPQRPWPPEQEASGTATHSSADCSERNSGPSNAASTSHTGRAFCPHLPSNCEAAGEVTTHRSCGSSDHSQVCCSRGSCCCSGSRPGTQQCACRPSGGGRGTRPSDCCLQLEHWHLPARPADVANLSGAGDSLVGGALAALAAGEGIYRAVALGTALAHCTVQSQGNVPRGLDPDSVRGSAKMALSSARKVLLP